MYFIDLIMQATTLEPIHNGDFSFWSLFVRADWVVKLVMIILIVASIWSWAIAVDKGITMFLLKRRAKLFEETFWSGKRSMSFQERWGAIRVILWRASLRLRCVNMMKA